MVVDDLTVMVITHNEAANLERLLESIPWAKRILVVDSGSTDATIDIALRYEQCTVVERRFDTFANQCNWGLSQVRTKWVLSVDADYVLTEDLSQEIRSITGDTYSGFRVPFAYSIYGRRLKGSLYPPRTVLYQKSRAKYKDEGHGHRVVIDGKVGNLIGRIVHDDRKPLSRWFNSQQVYAQNEAEFLLSTDPRKLSRTDRIRLRGWLSPLLILPYTMLCKRAALSGLAGWFYSLQRTAAEVMIALAVIDRKLRSRATHADDLHQEGP